MLTQKYLQIDSGFYGIGTLLQFYEKYLITSNIIKLFWENLIHIGNFHRQLFAIFKQSTHKIRYLYNKQSFAIKQLLLLIAKYHPYFEAIHVSYESIAIFTRITSHFSKCTICLPCLTLHIAIHIS